MTAPLAVVWSRPLPDGAEPSTVTVSRDRDRLARAQRRLARIRKGSANRDEARLKVARIHARITDRRKDFLHQLTTWLVRDNQAVVIEDLSVLAASLPLGARERDCAHCGARHDRDVNAAVNIKAAGLAVLACGAGVRPDREPSRPGGRP
jgi:putative transposase